MKPTLLVLAAGLGSRYGGLKQIDAVGPSGEAIIDYSIYDARRAGFGKLVFVIRHDIAAAFAEAVAHRFAGQLPIDYAFQELDQLPAGFVVPPDRKKPWGTAHAILAAASKIAEPFAVINADDFYGAGSFQVLADQLVRARDTAAADYAMVGFVLRHTLSEFGSVARAVCRTNELGVLQNIVELTKIEKDGDGARFRGDDGQDHPLTGAELVSMNMFGFTPSVFAHFREEFVKFLRASGPNATGEFFIPTPINNLIKAGRARMTVLPTQSAWFGITYREDKPAVVRNIQALIAQGVYPRTLWS